MIFLIFFFFKFIYLLIFWFWFFFKFFFLNLLARHLQHRRAPLFADVCSRIIYHSLPCLRDSDITYNPTYQMGMWQALVWEEFVSPLHLLSWFLQSLVPVLYHENLEGNDENNTFFLLFITRASIKGRPSRPVPPIPFALAPTCQSILKHIFSVLVQWPWND